MLVAEYAAVQQAEQRRADTDGDRQRNVPAEAAAQGEGGQRDERAMADVAEHHAEHQHEADGEHQCGIELAIARHSVVHHQSSERLQPAMVAHQRGYLQAFVAARIARLQRVALAQIQLQQGLQPRQPVARDPAAHHGQAAASAHQRRQFGVRGGAREPLRGIAQTRAQRLLRRFGAPARILLCLLCFQAGQAAAQLAAHLVGLAVELGRDLHGAPAGRLQHAFDRRCLATGTGNDQMHLLLAAEETNGDIAGQGQRFFEARHVGARQCADAHIQQRAPVLQPGEVDADVLELVERTQQLRGAPVFLVQRVRAFLVCGAFCPHGAQPVAGHGQLLRRDRLHRRFHILRHGDPVVGQYLVEVGAGLRVGLLVCRARQFGQQFGRDLAELGIEAAVIGEQQGGLRRVLPEQTQFDAQHGQGLEHQCLPCAFVASPSAVRIMGASMCMSRPRTMARKRRRSRSRSSM